MAQTTAPATSIPDEESLESRMVVTFLISGLESVVSREVKLLCHKSVLVFAGLHQYIASHWAAEKMDCCIFTILCVVQPAVTLSLLGMISANSNLVSYCGVVVLKIILSNKQMRNIC